MARTREEIKNEMIDAFMADETLQHTYGFNPNESFASQFSKVSIENIIFSIVASAIWVLENLFDRHQEEVSNIISKRAHTFAWYRETALNFQYGGKLRDDLVAYDNTGMTDDEIERQKIVKKASCGIGDELFPNIIVKASKTDGKLSPIEKEAFTSYMKEKADAGIKVTIVSEDVDKIALGMTIYYDPLLINYEGTFYNGYVKEIVEKYVQDYLNNLEYNGRFFPNLLEKYLMECDGIKVANVTSVWTSISNNGVYEIAKDKSNLDSIEPNSGAFVYDKSIKELNINYIAFSQNG